MDIIAKVKALDFPEDEYIVVGSGIMDMYKLKQAHDIDIVVSKNLFQKCKKKGWDSVSYTYQEKLGQDYLQKGDIELYLDVNCGEKFRPTLEELLNRKKVFEGIPFIGIRDLLKFKKSYNRPKDKDDIKIIEAFLKK